eukprot:TRINITY_DN25348_c0_g1_i3.p1 TRINITY_DN25348_c0_g1~~TRINITY_DN25348_c0_g1_i3.p1  ORF type:complete len:1120 (-),score=242.44 TRINITY_DN25348_c0_g1_i3:82-3441(-)
MAGVEAAEVADFQILLEALVSLDDDRRRDAECVYKEAKRCDPDRLCTRLAIALTNSFVESGDAVALRRQAAYLLRQCFKGDATEDAADDCVWPHLSSTTRIIVVEQFAAALRSEPVASVRRAVSNAAALLACLALEDRVRVAAGMQHGEWPDIDGLVIELLFSSSSEQRENALLMVREMLTRSPQVTRSLLQGNLARALEVSWADPSPSVRVEAVLLAALVLQLPDRGLEAGESQQPLRELVPMRGLLTALQSVEAEAAHFRLALEAMVQVVEVVPEILPQPLVEECVQMALAICRARDRLAAGLRHVAFEMLASLVEGRSQVCKQNSKLVQDVLRVCMEYMLELDQDASVADDAARELRIASGCIDVDDYDVGEEAIDRVARALGGDAIACQVLELAREFGRQDDWKHRYVAVTTLAQCAETLCSQEHVGKVLALLLSSFEDSHARVRFAAVHAVGQISTDQAPYVQEKHSATILPALSRCVEDQARQVAAHACIVLVSFIEELDPEGLLPYAPALVASLLNKISESGFTADREQALNTITVIAGILEASFVQYYDDVVPILKQLVQTNKGEDSSTREKAFECFSCLGLAVGPAVFQQDAREIMQAILESLGAGSEAISLQATDIAEALQRLCVALGPDFVPYLPQLLPGLLHTLQQPAALASSNEDQAIQSDQIDTFRRTLRLIACFMDTLGAHYFDHIEATAQSLLMALNARLHDEVQREALQAWQELLAAARVGLAARQLPDDGTGLLVNLFGKYLRTSLASMASETNLDLLHIQVVTMSACLRTVGAAMVTPQEVHDLSAAIGALVSASMDRQGLVSRGRSCDVASGDEENEEEAAEVEQCTGIEASLRLQCAEIWAVLMEQHPETFASLALPEILPVLQRCLAPSDSSQDRLFTIRTLGSIWQHLGAAGIIAWPGSVEATLKAIADTDLMVQQCAACCVFHAAKLQEFSPFAPAAAAALAQVLAPSGERRSMEENRVSGLETVAAALGALCRLQGALFENDLVWYVEIFVDMLPLTLDLDRAGAAHEFLMFFALIKHPALQRHFIRVLCVFLEVYSTETSTEALDSDIQRLLLDVGGDEGLAKVQPPIPDNLRHRARKVLSDAQQKAVGPMHA